MAEVTDVEMYRDGGTIEFRISGSEVGGLYRLQTPLQGTPQPLFRDGMRLAFGSADEVAVLAVLRDWLSGAITADVAAALAELDQTPLWQHLPERLVQVIPIHRVRCVAQRLEERVPRRDCAGGGVGG